MQQIAEKANVSRMAVSLALRGSPKVSQKTTKRIRAIAEELGYRPNPLVSALMTQLRLARPSPRTTTIAYVTAFPTRDGWKKSAQLQQYFEGAQRRSQALGYELEEWWLREAGMTQHRVGEILYARGIHGVLVAPLPAADTPVHFDWSKFSAATIGYSFAEAAIHRASNDPFHSVRLALRELMQLGYRRIGLALTREEDAQVEHRWSAGVLVHQAEMAAEHRVPILLSEGALAGPFVEWFRKHRPDAVLSHSSECVAMLAAIGIRVPKDAGFAQLALSMNDTDVAGVDEKYPLVGAAAIDLVDTQLRRNELGVPHDRRTVLIGGTWVHGSTLRQQTKKRK
jgi:DNA-binding LacI/PurR family transcriptional regulator